MAVSIFEALKGRWLRPDGGYIIEIRKVDPDGAVDAGYFNPNPIKVFKAKAAMEGAAISVFLELRDIGYPGSTYKLTYDSEKDQLTGIYYQAQIRQSFEVFFVRVGQS